MGRRGYSGVRIFCTVYVCVRSARVCVRECLNVCMYGSCIFLPITCIFNSVTYV